MGFGQAQIRERSKSAPYAGRRSVKLQKRKGGTSREVWSGVARAYGKRKDGDTGYQMRRLEGKGGGVAYSQKKNQTKTGRSGQGLIPIEALEVRGNDSVNKERKWKRSGEDKSNGRTGGIGAS